MPAFPS